MQGFFTSEQLDSCALAACHKCGLYKQARSPKIGYQHGSNGIMFVGDYPNYDADLSNHPIAGTKYDWLNGVLDEYGVSLSECSFTNAAICHSIQKQTASSWNQIFEYCRPNLNAAIDEIAPRVIIPMGWPALKAVFPSEASKFGGPLKKWVGWHIPSGRFNAWVCPVDDPKEIGKTKVGEVLFRQSLQSALELREKSIPKARRTLDELHSLVDVVLSKDEARSRLSKLATTEGYLSFDYETTGLKPEAAGHEIVCCGFYAGEGRPWACMIDEDLHESLSAVLRNKALYKIASNLKFEERWTRTMLGHGVSNWYWDTMLAAHYLDNRGKISSVKFQAFVQLGVPPWDSEVEHLLEAERTNDLNSVKNIPRRTLLLYCALDAYLEYKVMICQQKGMTITY